MLEHKFGDGAVKSPDCPTVVEVLPRLATGPVITTNFDHILEKAFRGAQRAFDLSLWGGKIQTASDVLAEDLHLLLKLHGDVLNDTDRVLTLTEYDLHYGSVDAERADLSRPLPQLLSGLFQTRSLLFLGCSLEGDRYLQLLRRVVADESRPEHFACVAAPAAEGEFRKREDHLRAHRITPIWIPDGKFEALVPLLSFIADVAGTSVRQHRGRIPLSFATPSSRQAEQDARRRTRAHADCGRILQQWGHLRSDKKKVAFLRRHGEALYHSGFYQEYIRLATEAAQSAERVGQDIDHAEFLYNMHLTLRKIGGESTIAKADDCLARAEKVLAGCELSSLQGKVVHDRAVLHEERDDLQAALAGFRRAAKLSRSAGDHRIGTTLIALGRVRERLGRSGARVRYARWAAAYSEKHSEDQEQARALRALAHAHADAGQTALAREAQAKAITLLLRSKGDQRTLAAAINDVGAEYHSQKDSHIALDFFLRAVWWHQQMDNQCGLAANLGNIAWLHWEAAFALEGDKDAEERRIASLRRSVDYFSQAIALERSTGDELGAARQLVYRSMPLAGIGSEQQALSDIEGALPALLARDDLTSVAVALNNRGTIQQKLGNLPDALKSYRSACGYADKGPELAIRKTARENLIKALSHSDDVSESNRIKDELEALGPKT
jgi:tetratricopeptide (TPR) repeat protein